MIGNTVKNAAKVEGNLGGTTVTTNTIGTNLTVLGNGAPTVDKPNTVGGMSKLQ